MTEQVFHLRNEHGKLDPLSFSQLQEAYVTGQINAHTYIQTADTPEALQLKDLPQLISRMPHLGQKQNLPRREKGSVTVPHLPPRPRRPKTAPSKPLKQIPVQFTLHQILPRKSETFIDDIELELEKDNEEEAQTQLKPMRTRLTWQEYRVGLQEPYYHNLETGELSHEDPNQADLEAYFRDHYQDEFVWLQDATEGFFPVRLVKAENNESEIYAETIPDVGMWEPRQGLIDAQQIYGPVDDPTHLCECPADLIKLDISNTEQNALHFIRQRFLRNLIYTRVGKIMISVNPFKVLPIYTPEMVDLYKESIEKDLPPHVFAVAAQAYHNVIHAGTSQAIVISGESGSGKTEATKLCLQYLSDVAGNASGIEGMIVSCSPILEAFGNAKTVRNNNSSRFGKFLELRMDINGFIEGCNITSYLLEKSRVVSPSPQERNFHILYQLCANTSHSTVQDLNLGRPETFAYLNRGYCTTIPGIDEVTSFRETLQALRTLDIPEDDIKKLFSICAGILHLGNVTFKSQGSQNEPEGCQVTLKGASQLREASRLFGCTDTEVLAERLVTRNLCIRGERMSLQLSAIQAAESRDALAKELYARIFEWLLVRINRSFGQETQHRETHAIIGVLDIFGFEAYDVNSLEQLCINYANEKLQEQFNRCIFVSEQEKCASEGVSLPPIDFPDNQQVLEVLESHPRGLFILFDDEISVPKASDGTLFNKITQSHSSKSCFRLPKGDASRSCFILKHYAGRVQYSVDGFLAKNKDTLHEDIAILIDENMSFMNNGSSHERKRSRISSISGKFRKQLRHLMDTLKASEPHFIRCIKPNQQQQDGIMDGACVLHQLRCAGITDAISIQRGGYPFGIPHKSFYHQYRVLRPVFFPPVPKEMNLKEACAALLEDLNSNLPYAIGETKVLWGFQLNRWLRDTRRELVKAEAIVIQRQVRRFIHQSLYQRVQRILRNIETAIEEENIEELDIAIQSAEDIPMDLTRVISDAQNSLSCIQEKRRLSTVLNSMDVHVSAENIQDGLEDILRACDEIGYSSERLISIQIEYDSVQETRKVLTRLQKALEAESVDKNELEIWIRRCAEYEDSFNGYGRELLAKGESVLLSLRMEETMLEYVRSAIALTTITLSHMKQRRKVDQTRLHNAVAIMQSTGVKTEEGQELCDLAVFLRDLRSYIQIVLYASAIGTDDALSVVEMIERMEKDDAEDFAVDDPCISIMNQVRTQMDCANALVRCYMDVQNKVEIATAEIVPKESDCLAALLSVSKARSMTGLVWPPLTVSKIEKNIETIRSEQLFVQEIEAMLLEDWMNMPSEPISSESKVSIVHFKNIHHFQLSDFSRNDTKCAFAVAECMTKLKWAFKHAIAIDSHAEAQAAWKTVEFVLVAEFERIHCMPGRNDPTLLTIFDIVQANVDMLKRIVSTKIAIGDIAEKLSIAVENQCEEWLRYGLSQAEKLGMESIESVQAVVLEAKIVMDQIEICHEALRQAMESYDDTALDESLKTAECMGLVSKDVKDARQFYLELSSLLVEASEAQNEYRRNKLAAVNRKCSDFGLENEDVKKIRCLLSLSDDDLLQSQLENAKNRGDDEISTEITMKIRKKFIQKAGKAFEFSNFPKLRSSDDLTYSATAIGLSLTKLHGSDQKKALNMFKNILGYSGDRHYSYPTMLAQDILLHGLHSESLADEIYCQLIKQLSFRIPNLTEIPRGPLKKKNSVELNREDKLWELFSLCLLTFRPSEAFMNFLEYFLRSRNRLDFVRKLHETVNRYEQGIEIKLPSLDSIFGIANPLAASRTTGWLSKVGSRSRFARKRWFVLEGTKLHYFRNDKAKDDAIGVIDLITLQSIDEYPPNHLAIELVGSDKPHVLIADTIEEKQRWYKAIRSARAAYWDRVMHVS